MGTIGPSTNEMLRLLLGAPEREAKPNCRLVEDAGLTGIEKTDEKPLAEFMDAQKGKI